MGPLILQTLIKKIQNQCRILTKKSVQQLTPPRPLPGDFLLQPRPIPQSGIRLKIQHHHQLRTSTQT
jgi:hypothetical protein